MQPFGHNRYGPKIGGLCPFWGGGAGSPPNTRWPGQRPTCTPSFILIRPTVWPQCTNVTDRTDRTDRQDRHRTDSVGQTVFTNGRPKIAVVHYIATHRHVEHRTSDSATRMTSNLNRFWSSQEKFVASCRRLHCQLNRLQQSDVLMT